MTLDLGILLALACAFVANLGFFYKYRGANSVPKVQALHPIRSASQLYSSKWFCLGMLTATASWGLHVAALSLAPMSVVQVALAAGVVFIAVMAERLFGFEVGKRQWIGLIADGRRARPARRHAARHARRALALLERRHDLLRGRPVLHRRSADHGPAHGRPGRAPRRDARRRRRRPVRRLRHRDQGADRHHRLRTASSASSRAPGSPSRSPPRSSPSTPPPAACRTATPSR